MSTPEAHPVSPDAAREAEIDFWRMTLATATTPAARRAAWNELCALEDQRDVARDLERGTGSIEKARG